MKGVILRRRFLSILGGAFAPSFLSEPATPGPLGAASANGRTLSPTFQVDHANTGFAPDTSGPQESPRVDWYRPIGHNMIGAPTLFDGGLIIPTIGGPEPESEDAGERFVCVDPDTGSVRWETASLNFGINGGSTTGVVADTDHLYVKALNEIIAIDNDDGSKVWVQEGFDDDGDLFPAELPVLYEGTLYVASGGTQSTGIAALDPQSGDTIWTNGGLLSDVAGIAAADSRIFAAGGDAKQLFCLDAADGGVLWAFSSEEKMRCKPTVSDGIVYAASSHDRLYAIDADSGNELWSRETSLVDNSVAVTGNSVIHSDFVRVAAFDKESGELQWENGKWGNGGGSPIIAGDTVYQMSSNRLVALSLSDGAERWSIQLGLERGHQGTPVVSDGTVFVGADGYFFAIRDGPDSTDPSARISHKPEFIRREGDVISFSATDSRDNDGAIEQYEWKISNDYYSGKEVSHSFEFITGGNRRAHLLTIDGSGATDLDSVDIPLDTASFDVHIQSMETSTGGQGNLTVSVGITNAGESTRSEEIEVSFDEQVSTSRTIELAPGQSTNESFVLEVDDEGGDYSLDVTGADASDSTTVSVSDRSRVRDSPGNETGSGIPAIGGALAATAGVGGLSAVACLGGYVWLRRTGSRSSVATEPLPDTSGSSCDELVTEGDQRVTSAQEARASGDLEEAIEAYREALDFYQDAQERSSSSSEGGGEDLETAITAAHDEMEAVQELQRKRSTLTDLLSGAENAFRTATVAFANGDTTLARIRYRQAREGFSRALDATKSTDRNVLEPGLEVPVQPQRERLPDELGSVPVIDDELANLLSQNGLDTLDDLQDRNELASGGTETSCGFTDFELTPETGQTGTNAPIAPGDEFLLCSLMCRFGTDNTTFDDRMAMKNRKMQADHGFEICQ